MTHSCFISYVHVHIVLDFKVAQVIFTLDILYTSVLRALTSNTHRHFVNPPWIRSVTVVWNERNGMRTWGQMFADMAEGGDAGEGGYERACSLSELQAAGRKRVTVQGRIVALFHVSSQVYALDHFCYREYKPWEQTGDLVHYTL